MMKDLVLSIFKVKKEKGGHYGPLALQYLAENYRDVRKFIKPNWRDSQLFQNILLLFLIKFLYLPNYS